MSDGLTFYLGTPEPSWLRRCTGARLFVSHRRLARKVRLPRAGAPWALDSGGFNEITEHGGWQRVPADEYVRAVARYDREIGCMEWAAPQDWMCEPAALAATGRTVAEHIALSVESYVTLAEMWPQHSDATCPIMPVLQGADPSGADHLACVEAFTAAGVDLAAAELVGVGSVCRLQSTGRIRDVVGKIAAELPGVPLHGFGVKLQGIEQVGDLLASADSQAWSLGARMRDVRHPECTHASRSCSWCPRAAMTWAEDVVGPRTMGWFDEWGTPPWRHPREVA